MAKRTRTTKIVVHCSATPSDRDVDAAEIRRWHVDENGWDDIGYHFVIRRDGTIEPGRDLDAVGAHCLSVNYESVGVCLVGGLDTDLSPLADYMPAQMRSLEILLDGLVPRFESPLPDVVAHSDLDDGKPDCPGFDGAEWYTTVD